MLLPVRCFTCNKVIGHLQEKWENVLDTEANKEETLNAWNIKRYCCRRMFLGYVPLIDQVILYSQPPQSKFRQKSVVEINDEK